MANTVELVVKLLGDASHAEAAFTGFASNIGKALGIGAGATAVAAVTTVATKAAVDQQAAMARIVASYNSADFQPGTAAYKTAVDSIINQSQTLNTNFDDVAAVHNQAARFIDSFGNRLPAEKIDEYTDSVLKLSKVSLDNIAPTDLESKIATFEKLSTVDPGSQGGTNFGPVANAIAASSSIHSMGEGPMIDAANAILKSGGLLGITQAQAGGFGNYLSELGGGGERGGASIGRMLLRQNTAADALLDPSINAGKAKRARESQEHLDDLQTSLREAEASQAQMFGQHGLKTQYQKNPEAVMQSEDRIAKLNREIADSKADQLTDAAIEANTKKGQYNLASMGQTAGMTAIDYAQLAKDNPAEALEAFSRGLHDLPVEQRGAAIMASGIGTSQKDVGTLGLLAVRPDVLAEQIDTFQKQLDTPAALGQMFRPVGDTTAAKMADFEAMQKNIAAAGGEGPRQGFDALLDNMMKLGKEAQDGSGPVGALVAGLDSLGGVIGPVSSALLPYIGYKMASRGAGGGAAGAKGAPSVEEIATGDWTPEDLERIRNGGLGQKPGPTSMLEAAGGLLAGGIGGLAAGGVGYLQLNQMSQSLDDLNKYRQSQGLAPVQVNIGDIVHQGGSPDEILDHVITAVRAAWATAMSSTPVSGAVGGNVGNMAPR